MTDPPDPRVRLRFEDFSLDVSPDGSCRIEVVLEWEGERFTHLEETTATTQGKLLGAARAAVRAAQAMAVEDLTLELRGVKAVRAFDAWVVIASISGESPEERYRLLGAATCRKDEAVPRSSVLAVLDALNRVLEKYLPEGSAEGV